MADVGMFELFQSTPDLINRENIVTPYQTLDPLLFQSTPDLINRENTEIKDGCMEAEGFNPLPI